MKEVLGGLKSAEFHGPGSIVRVSLDEKAGEGPAGVTVLGMPAEFAAYFDRSLAFEVPQGHDSTVLARYAEVSPLESGWLLGPEKIQGKAALVEVPLGKGRVILFGFPPQHRGQTHGTFRLLLNGLLRSTAGFEAGF